MEKEITWLILTVAVNALVTGTLIFIFQKRVEGSLSRKSFEHQTKFAGLYGKRMKALEEFCQKFEEYKLALWFLSIDTKNLMDGEKKYKHKEYIAKRDAINDKSRDLLHFYTTNSLFLSRKAHEIILVTISQTPVIQLVILTLSHDFTMALVDEKPIIWEKIVDMLALIKIEDVDISNPETVLDKVNEKLGEMSNNLQKLYESEASSIT